MGDSPPLNSGPLRKTTHKQEACPRRAAGGLCGFMDSRMSLVNQHFGPQTCTAQTPTLGRFLRNAQSWPMMGLAFYCATTPHCRIRWVPVAKSLYDSTNSAQMTLAHELRRHGVGQYYLAPSTHLLRFQNRFTINLLSIPLCDLTFGLRNRTSSDIRGSNGDVSSPRLCFLFD